ncbi:unnamed protein product [Dibothriocephalus latus]|uniref:Uncharacterized protein n=1 Tax=Dibothriocephalus latus TaxID=60516 RepID=A0A3P7LHI7_DIBLA|nr:unnamed protein product [Dibothriocephalus latus]
MKFDSDFRNQLRFLYEFLAYCISVEGLGGDRNVIAKAPAPALPRRAAPNEDYDLPKGPVPLTINPPQNEEYSLPKKGLPGYPSLGEPSTGMPSRPLPTPSTLNPPQNEEYGFPKRELPSDQGEPSIPQRPMLPGSASQKFGVDAQNGRFVLPGQPRPGKSSPGVHLVIYYAHLGWAQSR